MKDNLEFSVILPVVHGGEFLRDAIESLYQVDFPSERFEVVVVGPRDDKEAKATLIAEAMVAPLAVIYVDSDGMNRSKQLNAACRAARGRFLVFSDDDCVFPKDWLAKWWEVLYREDNLGIAGGNDELENGGSTFDLALDAVLNSFTGTGGLRQQGIIRVGKYYPKLWNMAVPREVAVKVGLEGENGLSQIFNECLTVHEDVDLARRIEKQAKRIIYAPEVRVRHKRGTTFRSFVYRNFTMARTSRALGAHRMPHTTLTLFIVGMFLLGLASLWFSTLRLALIILIAIYGAVLLATSIKSFVRTKRIQALVFIPVLIVSLHIARGLGYLFRWGK